MHQTISRGRRGVAAEHNHEGQRKCTAKDSDHELESRNEAGDFVKNRHKRANECNRNISMQQYHTNDAYNLYRLSNGPLEFKCEV